MEFFGWLTKPELQVSFLDRLIIFGELLLLTVVSIFLYMGYLTFKGMFKRKK